MSTHRSTRRHRGRHSNRTARWLALPAATLAAVVGLASPSPALAGSDQAATIIADGAPVSLPAIHPCTGEFVVVDFFELRVVLRFATDGAGNFHEVQNISGKFAIGELTGRFHETYIINDFNPGASADSVTTDIQVYVGAGSDRTRMIARVILHVRLDGGGAVVEISDFKAHCLRFP